MFLPVLYIGQNEIYAKGCPLRETDFHIPDTIFRAHEWVIGLKNIGHVSEFKYLLVMIIGTYHRCLFLIAFLPVLHGPSGGSLCIDREKILLLS